MDHITTFVATKRRSTRRARALRPAALALVGALSVATLGGCDRKDASGGGARSDEAAAQAGAPRAPTAPAAEPTAPAAEANAAAPPGKQPPSPPSAANEAPAADDAPAPDPDRVRVLIEAYEKARLGLALDDIQATRGGAEALRVAAAGFAATLDGAARNRLSALAEAAKGLGSTADFAAARLAFGKVSTQIIQLAHGAKLGGEVFVFQCPMVEQGEPRWLQSTAEMNNPYMGKRMPKCGGRVPLRPSP